MDYKKIYQTWLNDERLNEEGRKELLSLAENEKELEYRFGALPEFGTAGMRGIIGYGTNMMNRYTVMRATKGLAKFIQARKNGTAISKKDMLCRFSAQRD